MSSNHRHHNYQRNVLLELIHAGLHKLTGLSLETHGKEWRYKMVIKQNQANKHRPNVQNSV